MPKDVCVQEDVDDPDREVQGVPLCGEPDAKDAGCEGGDFQQRRPTNLVRDNSEGCRGAENQNRVLRERFQEPMLHQGALLLGAIQGLRWP